MIIIFLTIDYVHKTYEYNNYLKDKWVGIPRLKYKRIKYFYTIN